MGRTVATDQPCGDPWGHWREKRQLEWELKMSWESGLPLRPDWESSTEFVEPDWHRDHGAILRTYWLDMKCGCVFGALCCTHLEAD